MNLTFSWLLFKESRERCLLCLTLSGKTIDEDLADFWRNRSFIDMAELRLDYLLEEEVPKARTFPPLVDLPVVLTCRRASDGGVCRQTERRRIAALAQNVEGGFAYLDLEADVKRPELEDLCRKAGVQIIRSFHDLEKVPLDLYDRATKIAARGEIPKLVAAPRSAADLVLLFNAEKELSHIKRKIILGVGEIGAPTRILYKRTGSFMTYCAEREVVPGIMTPWSLSELYRADKVNAKTRIFGVLGPRALASAAPRAHNPGFLAIRFNAVHVPFPLDSVRSFFKLADVLGIDGFSVEGRFKRDILPYLGKCTREVQLMGSCNTAVRTARLWKGVNTCYYGFNSLLQPHAGGEGQKTALVIGAGEAATAAVWALRNSGLKVVILDRDPDEARRLASRTMSAGDSLENAASYTGTADIIVQATSVGTYPNPADDPAPELLFTGRETVFEFIARPTMTRFLSRASQAGCETIMGSQILAAQEKFEFLEFTGYHYPQEGRLPL